jgi:hypothetical protein
MPSSSRPMALCLRQLRRPVVSIPLPINPRFFATIPPRCAELKTSKPSTPQPPLVTRENAQSDQTSVKNSAQSELDKVLNEISAENTKRANSREWVDDWLGVKATARRYRIKVTSRRKPRVPKVFKCKLPSNDVSDLMCRLQ